MNSNRTSRRARLALGLAIVCFLVAIALFRSFGLDAGAPESWTNVSRAVAQEDNSTSDLSANLEQVDELGTSDLRKALKPQGIGADLDPHGGQATSPISEASPIANELSGRVFFANGKPASNASLLALPAGAKELPDPGDSDRHVSTLSNYKGEFQLLLPPGDISTWDIFASYGISRAEQKSVRAPSIKCELELPTLAEVGIRLLDSVTGETVRGGRVAWRVSGTAAWRVPDPIAQDIEGVSWFEVFVGSADLMARSHDAALRPAMVLGVSVDDQASIAWDLVPQPGLQLTIVFRSESLEERMPTDCPPILYSTEDSGFHAIARTESARFQFIGLSPGSYTLIEPPAIALEPLTFEVGSESERVIEITWKVSDHEKVREMDIQWAKLLADPEHGFWGPGDY